MSDLQTALASLSGKWQLGQLIDIGDDEAKEDLRRLSAAALSIVAQSARGADKPPVPQEKVLEGETAAERFLLAWRGEVNPAHAKAIDTYWICTAEHGLNASTFTARIVASTGADSGAALSAAVGALSGPLHGGAPARVLPMLDAVAEMGDAEKWVTEALARKERIMGFGHRIYRAEDPRSRLLKKTAKELGSPRVEVAEALEQAAHEAIAKKHPDHSYTNVEFWSAIVLDVAEVPPRPRCSRARARPAGRRTCSSRSEPACSCGRLRSTSGRERAACKRCKRGQCRPVRSRHCRCNGFLRTVRHRVDRPRARARRHLRDRSGSKITTFAEVLPGITPYELGAAVSGSRAPSVQLMEECARFLRVKPDYFLEYRRLARLAA